MEARVKRAKSAGAAVRQIEERPRLEVATAGEIAFSAIGVARVHAASPEGFVVDVGGALAPATLDPSVHPVVVEGAFRRGERVLVERGRSGAVVILGALRTQPTPGIDAADAYVIEAKRVSVEAGEEITLSTRTAAVVLRAIGEVETYADRILSRAEGVHKIVGRMLRLN
jgi:hypothetical protein